MNSVIGNVTGKRFREFGREVHCTTREANGVRDYFIYAHKHLAIQ